MNHLRSITVASSLALTAACGLDPVSEPSALEAQSKSPLTLNHGFSIDRVIPLRFVQFSDATHPSLTSAQLDEQVSGMNDVFAPAGLQFVIRQTHELANSVFTDTSTATTYTWPSDLTQAPPLVFNPTCPMPRPGVSETEETSLFRAGSYCAFDGEILIYTIASRSPGGQSHGPYPWEANAVIMQRLDMNAGNRTLAHEVGHYLGLSHSFGGTGSYDLQSSNLLNPQTGAPATRSDFWDLVYQPGSSPQTNKFFGTRAAAAAVESQLLPIQTDAASGSICMAGVTPPCPTGTVDGTLRIIVGTTSANQAAYYTGSDALKGLGFVFTSGTPSRGVNVMSYNYPPSPGASRFSVSASQIAQLKRVLSFDVNSGWFPNSTGRRPYLGLGRGTWTSWESIGGSTTDVPQAVTRTAGRIDVVVRGSDGAVYNKVLQANGWWPSQTGWASIGGATTGSPALAVRGDGSLDVAVRGSDNSVYLKSWSATTSTWIPSQTDWSSLGGSVADSPRVGERTTGEIDVVVLGSDNVPYNKVWNPSNGWWPSQTGWVGLGGSATSTPAILELANGQIELTRHSSDNHAADKRWSAANGWSPSQTDWSDLGAGVAETPSVTSWGDAARSDLVTRATDGTVENKVWQGFWWPSNTAWSGMGGALAGRPTATTWGSGRLDVVARGTDGSVLYKWWESATGWWPSQTDWAVLGGTASSDPIAVTWGPGRLDIFVRGSDGAVWHRARTQ